MTGPIEATWTDPRFVEGAEHYDAGRYFEAHEAWEHLWRALPPGEEKLQVQGLIQLAVSLEHHRRGNPRGRDGQWSKASSKLTGDRAGPVLLPPTLAAARAAMDRVDGVSPRPRLHFAGD